MGGIGLLNHINDRLLVPAISVGHQINRVFMLDLKPGSCTLLEDCRSYLPFAASIATAVSLSISACSGNGLNDIIAS